MDDRHALAHALERQLVDLGPFHQLVLQVEPCLLRGDQQAALGGVADHAPALVLCRRQHLGVVAEGHGTHHRLKAPHDLVLGQRGIVQHELPDRLVAGAGDLVVLTAHVHRLHRHLSLRQRAGLVGADDIGGPERLDRGELLDEGVHLGHALHADGQRHGEGRRQAFRHQCHHDAQGEEKGGDHAEVEDDQREDEEQNAAGKGDHRHGARHPVDLALKGRLLLGHSGRE